MSFVEMRTYDLTFGAIPLYLAAYRETGYPTQRRYLGEPVGWYTTEVGSLNQIIHLWRYESLEDRATRRAALAADSEWAPFIKKIQPLVLKQTTQLLNEPDLG
ncbi:MAG: NIPSNAP family protein [Acidobacteria bacterium]|nr:NIPSNAP family protein [Acidobacteriota bacterium]